MNSFGISEPNLFVLYVKATRNERVLLDKVQTYWMGYLKTIMNC